MSMTNDSGEGIKHHHQVTNSTHERVLQLLLEKDEAIHGDEGIGEVIFLQW
jgi:hypothetical protein